MIKENTISGPVDLAEKLWAYREGCHIELYTDTGLVGILNARSVTTFANKLRRLLPLKKRTRKPRK